MANQGKKRLIKALKNWNDKTNEPRRNVRRGLLGRGLSEERSARVPGRTNYYYVRNRQNPSQIWEVYGTNVPNIPGLPVLLEPDPVDRSRMQIMEWDGRGMSNLPGVSGNVIGGHHEQHELHGWDMVNVDKGMFRPLRLRPTQPLSPDVLLEWDETPYLGTTLIDMELIPGYETQPIRGVRKRFLPGTGVVPESRYYLAVLTDEPDLIFLTGSVYNPLIGGFFVSGTTTSSYPDPREAAYYNGAPIAYVFAGATATVVRWQDIDDVRPINSYPGLSYATGVLIEDRDFYFTGSNVEQALQELGAFKGKLKVTDDDPIPDYLQGSLQEGPGISLQVVTQGSDKKIRVSATGTTSSSGGGGASVRRGAFGSRGAAGATGTLYLNTDGYTVDYDDGATWRPYGPIFSLVPPVDGDFAWVNQGGASVSADKNGIFLVSTASGGNNVRVRAKTAPSAPYTTTILCLPSQLGGTSEATGVGWRESGSGKMSLSFLQGGNIGVWNWTDANTHSGSTPVNIARGLMGQPYIWWRLRDDNTTRYVDASNDGQNWHLLYSVARTDFLTPDQLVFYTVAFSYPTGQLVLSWREV